MNSQKIKILIVAVVALAIAYIMPNSSSFVVLLATRALVFAILAMSLDILLGFTGLASLGQAAYFGIGAYFTAILAARYHFGLGWDFWLVVVHGHGAGRGLGGVFRTVRDPRHRRLFPHDHPGARPMRLGPGLSMEFADRRRQRHQCHCSARSSGSI